MVTVFLSRLVCIAINSAVLCKNSFYIYMQIICILLLLTKELFALEIHVCSSVFK